MSVKSSAEVPIMLHHFCTIPEELLVELVSSKHDEVLNLGEAAAFLRVSEQDVLRMIKEQGLPARQVGEDWRLLKAAIREWLRTGTPPRRSSKEALLAMAGSFKDDPDLDAIVKDAMRLRGRKEAGGE
jgi:excisionase family DNA binding protein